MMKPSIFFRIRMLLLVLLPALAACSGPEAPGGGGAGGGEAASAAQPAEAAPETLTLGVIPKSTGGEYWETVEQGARAAAEELGVEIRWEGTLTETAIAEQSKIVDNMINMGVDGLALAPLNEKALRKPVANATQAGIPVVIFDSDVEGEAQVSFVATNNEAGGRLAGEHLAGLLGGSGRVLLLHYVQGSGSTEARIRGARGALEAAGVEIVSDPYPEDGTVAGSKRTATNALEEFVREGRLDLDGIFACNLYSAIGMGAALDDLRKGGVEVGTKFVGFDSSPKLLEGLRAGDIDALVVQNPRRMGYLAVQTLTRHLRGEAVEPFIDTGVALVTAEKLENDPEIRRMVGAE